MGKVIAVVLGLAVGCLFWSVALSGVTMEKKPTIDEAVLKAAVEKWCDSACTKGSTNPKNHAEMCSYPIWLIGYTDAVAELRPGAAPPFWVILHGNGPNMEFVEIEDAQGRSCKRGEWTQRVEDEWMLGPFIEKPLGE